MAQRGFIDVNCDLGEGETTTDCQQDALLMPYISSCNIACGGHAGNQTTMQLSIENALIHQLKMGAHPGYPDKKNFGRTSITISPSQLEQTLRQQIDSLLQQAEKQSATIDHIKFHGALYNDIETQPLLAEQMVSMLEQFYPTYRIIGFAAGRLEKYCRQTQLNFIPEGFMDRRYQNNGLLTPRSQPGALISSAQEAIDQAIALATHGKIKTISQQQLILDVKTICLHGDTPDALTIAQQLKQALKEREISLR